MQRRCDTHETCEHASVLLSHLLEPFGHTKFNSRTQRDVCRCKRAFQTRETCEHTLGHTRAHTAQQRSVLFCDLIQPFGHTTFHPRTKRDASTCKRDLGVNFNALLALFFIAYICTLHTYAQEMGVNEEMRVNAAYTHTHTYTHANTLTQITHAHTHTRVLTLHTHTHTHIHTHTHLHKDSIDIQLKCRYMQKRGGRMQH